MNKKVEQKYPKKFFLYPHIYINYDYDYDYKSFLSNLFVGKSSPPMKGEPNLVGQGVNRNQLESPIEEN